MTNIRSKIVMNSIHLTDTETLGTLRIIVEEPECPFDEDYQQNPIVDLANDLMQSIVHKELQLRLEGESVMRIRKPFLVMLGRQSYNNVDVTVFSNDLHGDFLVKGMPTK